MGNNGRTRVCVAGEVARPLNKRMSLVLARCDREAADGAYDRGVTELRLGRDNRIGDIVVNRLRAIRMELATMFPSR